MLDRSPASNLTNPARRNSGRRVQRALGVKRRRFIVIDIESRSSSNLPTVGPHVYALDPQTEVRSVAILVDDGSVFMWRYGNPVPPHVRHDWPLLSYDRCIDTLTRAAAMGLPLQVVCEQGVIEWGIMNDDVPVRIFRDLEDYRPHHPAHLAFAGLILPVFQLKRVA